MDCEEISRSSPDPLPKSVKVRSTCNACQQAKIRCSHHKPSCQRCQKHNIECIYSVSRRLGRPAKRKDGSQDQSPDQNTETQPRGSSTKKLRCPKRRKVKEEQSQGKQFEDPYACDRENMLFDKTTLDDNILGNISGDDSHFNSAFMDGDRTMSFMAADSIGLSSDNWLADFTFNQPNDSVQEQNFLDCFGIQSPRTDTSFATFSAELKERQSAPRNFPNACTDTHTQPPMSCFSAQLTDTYAGNEPASTCSQDANEQQPPYTEYLKRDLFSWAQPLSTSSIDNISSRPFTTGVMPGFLAQSKIPSRAAEFESVPDDPRSTSNPFNSPIPRQNQCQFHEQTIRELMRVNMCAARTGPSVTIDAIMNCQRLLQQLSNTILQCGICSRTRVNLLMVVIVSIDSLITTLETIISMESGLVEGLFPEYPEQVISGFRQDVVRHTDGRRYKTGSFHFKAHVDACPLVVGRFCVPSEEKFSFVKQALHVRLAGLLAIVRRIRFCTQELFAISASRGRLVMMVETDKRLQVVMTKVRMMTRR